MCAVPIEKDEGCAQMMCKRCKHVFCWYCLASLDVSFLFTSRHHQGFIFNLSVSLSLSFLFHRMTFCCDIMTRDRAKINWVIRVPLLCGIALKLLAFLLALAFYCWWHRRYCCWQHRALFAASVAVAAAPRLMRSMLSWRRRSPHCRASSITDFSFCTVIRPRPRPHINLAAT